MYQDIDLKIPNPYDRKRDIVGLLFTFGDQDSFSEAQNRFRPPTASERLFERRTDPRGLKFWGTFVNDIETFGTTDVKKRDLFAGTSFCAWAQKGKCPLGGFDLGFELGTFDSEVTGDPSQDNSQRRYGVTMYYQINKDLVLLAPFRRDVARKGLDAFENWKGGIELRFFPESKNLFESVRYDRERFDNVDKSVDLFGVTIGLRF